MSGEPYIPEGSKRPVRVYPRDTLESFRILQSIGWGGVLPEGYSAERASVCEKPAAIEKPMLPLLPVNAHFSSITATTPDGTRFTARLERDGKLADGKAEVLGQTGFV